MNGFVFYEIRGKYGMVNNKFGMFMICNNDIIIITRLIPKSKKVAMIIADCTTSRIYIFLIFEVIMIDYFFSFLFSLSDFLSHCLMIHWSHRFTCSYICTPSLFSTIHTLHFQLIESP